MMYKIFVLFFINLLLVIQNISFKIIDNVNEKLTVSLYLEDEYDKNSEPVRLLINGIRDLWKWIEVFYKTKDDVLEDNHVTLGGPSDDNNNRFKNMDINIEESSSESLLMGDDDDEKDEVQITLGHLE